MSQQAKDTLMKVLVTGAAGFIGSRISRRLIDEGHDVIGLDSLTDYYDISIKLKNIARLESSKFQFVNVDLLNADLKSITKEVQVVFHQAGQPGVRKSWGTNFDVYSNANVLATQRLLDALVDSPSLSKVVIASSSSIYGNAESYPCLESDRPSPLSPYGVTKLAAEHLGVLYAKNFGVPTVALRYFTVYGPGQRPDMAFTRFIKSAIQNDEIMIYGDGNQARDFTYIDDIVEANFAAAFGRTSPGDVFNVAGGSNATVNEVLDILQVIAGKQLKVNYGPFATGDVMRTGGSSELINKKLGWLPRTDLKDGLISHYQWGIEIFGP